MFWREHVEGHRLHARSSGRAKQKMNRHMTVWRSQRNKMKAAQGSRQLMAMIYFSSKYNGAEDSGTENSGVDGSHVS